MFSKRVEGQTWQMKSFFTENFFSPKCDAKSFWRFNNVTENITLEIDVTYVRKEGPGGAWKKENIFTWTLLNCGGTCVAHTKTASKQKRMFEHRKQRQRVF